MANNKIFLGSVKSSNKLLKLINQAKSILKIQNLSRVNKFFKKAFAASFSALFVIHSVSFVSLKQAMAMNGPSNYGQEEIVQLQITSLQKIKEMISVFVQKMIGFLKKRELISDPEQWKIDLLLEIEKFEV
ncbi:MAG: hypothetical protein LBJ32_01250 [Oscillospiraceae bacterium]|jgi:hypothetical protein|nr:hypothetical protein [Oscillospiraceae bacterium]